MEGNCLSSLPDGIPLDRFPSLGMYSHRPWPVSSRRWAWRQRWMDLVFLHWEVDARRLRSLVPSGLEIDVFDGTAWVGLAPFGMRVARRGVPSLPSLFEFPEINVRTYVVLDGKPGVWFLSLDVPNPLAVWAARMLFHLPYFLASVAVERRGDRVDYWADRGECCFRASCELKGNEGIGDVAFARWATERYCLYAASRCGKLYRGEIHHRRWPLQLAEVEVEENTYLDGFGIGRRHSEVLFSAGIDVLVWPLVEVHADD